jgi:hypothetical protein
MILFPKTVVKNFLQRSCIPECAETQAFEEVTYYFVNPLAGLS